MPVLVEELPISGRHGGRGTVREGVTNRWLKPPTATPRQQRFRLGAHNANQRRRMVGQPRLRNLPTLSSEPLDGGSSDDV
jgi:hypothetical protein